MRVRRRTLLGSLAAAGAAAAIRVPGAPAAAPRALRLGILVPRSGYLAAAGNASFAGAELARQLLPSMHEPPFILIAGDTGADVESARTAADRLIAGGVDCIIGCYDSSQTVAVAALAERNRIPFIINVGAAPEIMQHGYRFVFRNFPEAAQIVRDSYSLQKELFRLSGYTPRRVVLLYINNGRGIELVESLREEAQMPYAWAGSIPYDPRATDLSKEVAQARESGADGVWLVSRMDDGIRITRELVRLDWTPGILMSSNAPLHEPAFRQALGAQADYAVTFAPFYDPKRPLSVRLRALQEKLHPGSPLGTAEVYTFEAVLIALDAFRRAASRTPEALAAALRTTNLVGVTGPAVRFDARGQNTALGLTAIQNLEGEARVVLPTTAAEARPVLPMPSWRSRSAGEKSG